MDFGTVLIALILGVLLYVTLAGVLRRFWISAPSEPDPETIESVNINFRCGVCGAEVTMTMAPQGEVPEAPRHCREDMILVTP